MHQNNVECITSRVGTQNVALGSQNGTVGWRQSWGLKLNRVSRFLMGFLGLKDVQILEWYTWIRNGALGYDMA